MKNYFEIWSQYEPRSDSFASLCAFGIFLLSIALNTLFYNNQGAFLPPDSCYRYIPIGLDLAVVWRGSVYDTPCYPLFIWVMTSLFGKGSALFLAQGFLAAAISMLIWRIGVRLNLGRLALIPAGLYAISPGTILFANSGLSETYFSFLLAMSCWQFLKLKYRGSSWRFIALGFVLALLTLTRANGLLIALVYGAGLSGIQWLLGWRWRNWLGFAVAFALPVLAWTHVNQRLTGLRGICQGSGWQFMHNLAYIGAFKPEALPENVRHLYRDWGSLGEIRNYHMYHKPPVIGPTEFDPLYMEIAKASVAMDPQAYVKALFRAVELPRQEVYDFADIARIPPAWAHYAKESAVAGYGFWVKPYDPTSPASRILSLSWQLNFNDRYLLLLTLNLVAFFVLLFRRDWMFLILLSVVMSNALALFLMANAIDRYYFPFECILLIGAMTLGFRQVPTREMLAAQASPKLSEPEAQPWPAHSPANHLILVPAYNEANSITAVVDACRAVPGWDLLVINDGSSDATAQVLCSLGVPHLDLPLNLGIGGAMQAGFLYASRKGYRAVAQIDGDGQHDPAILPRLAAELEHCDMVIGSRFVEKQGFQSTLLRQFGIRFLSKLLQVLTGKRILDCTSGLRLVNREVVARFCEYYPFDYPEPESLTMLIRSGFEVREVPCIMEARQSGASSIHGLKSATYMLKLVPRMILSAWIKRYPPKQPSRKSIAESLQIRSAE